MNRELSVLQTMDIYKSGNRKAIRNGIDPSTLTNEELFELGKSVQRSKKIGALIAAPLALIGFINLAQRNTSDGPSQNEIITCTTDELNAERATGTDIATMQLGQIATIAAACDPSGIDGEPVKEQGYYFGIASEIQSTLQP